MNEVVLHKAESLERCLMRITKTYSQHETDLEENYDAQDIINLNLQRACQITIDIGLILIQKQRLGIPKESKDVFKILAEKNIIPVELANNLQKMVGFRNIVVHEYEKVDYDVVRSIIEEHLKDFQVFIKIVLQN